MHFYVMCIYIKRQYTKEPTYFKAISQSKDIVYGVVKDYKTLLDKVMK